MHTIGSLLQDTGYPKKVILEKLIRHALDIKKEQLFTDIDREVSESEFVWIDAGYTDYTVNKKPLEYILGRVEFLGYHFNVSPATLIPRPETEYMIEAVNEYIGETNPSYPTSLDTPPLSRGRWDLLDIGTGCGVLGLSVLLHNKGAMKVAYLTDLSNEALDIAKKNYMSHKDDIGGLTPRFLEASLLDHPKIQQALMGPTIIVANLPYIPEQLFEDNTDDMVKKREPKMAFVGGDDGLDLYREMFGQLVEMKKENTLDTTLFLEMMTRQVDILRQEYKNIFTFEEVKTFHFNIRIVKARLI